MCSPSASPDALFNLVSNVPGFPWEKLLHRLINLLVRKFFSCYRPEIFPFLISCYSSSLLGAEHLERCRSAFPGVISLLSSSLPASCSCLPEVTQREPWATLVEVGKAQGEPHGKAEGLQTQHQLSLACPASNLLLTSSSPTPGTQR